ncbi:MAG: hypothetical protein QXZ25_04435 [Candidatus Bathyarchaeia archaeon]
MLCCPEPLIGLRGRSNHLETEHLDGGETATEIYFLENLSFLPLKSHLLAVPQSQNSPSEDGPFRSL